MASIKSDVVNAFKMKNVFQFCLSSVTFKSKSRGKSVFQFFLLSGKGLLLAQCSNGTVLVSIPLQFKISKKNNNCVSKSNYQGVPFRSALTNLPCPSGRRASQQHAATTMFQNGVALSRVKFCVSLLEKLSFVFRTPFVDLLCRLQGWC